MRRLLEILRLVRLVWTEDSDGEIRLRIVRNFGTQLRCNAICWGGGVILNSDGSTSGKCYVKKWYPYNHRSPQPTSSEWPEYIQEGWRSS